MQAFHDIERQLFEKGLFTIAGVDEAGRGPLAGPVVAAAVLVHPDTFLSGVEDSKVLSEKRREALYAAIVHEAPAYGIGAATPQEIDTLNILNATILAMHRALAALPGSPGHVLVDGNCFHHPGLPFSTVVRGDALCMSIAAASILAKVTRDRLMKEYAKEFPGYGFDRHKGYPTKAHYQALAHLGCCPIHRQSFFHLGDPRTPLFDSHEGRSED